MISNKMKNNKVYWCKNCVVMSTRPRIKFDERGFCGACQWSEEKKKIDWPDRQSDLKNLLDKHRSSKAKYDCITTVSGGKDGSYVSYNLKHKFKMNPLAVTIRPVTETELGKKNLQAFVDSGYDHLHVTPNQDAMRKLNKIGFIEMGFPYYGWLIAIHSAVLRVAVQFKIPLVFYSEDGEMEYGGDLNKGKDNFIYGVDYMTGAYLESGYEKIMEKANLTEQEMYWFKMPSRSELEELRLEVTHYGTYEDWDPYRNYQTAKKFCGLSENDELNEGSYTNFSQTDQRIYLLHVYMMYLKFGFGRTTQDAGIDVRRGAMTREQAVQLVRMYDDMIPDKYFEEYCDYYKMPMDEFLNVIDKWANKDLFEKKNRWIPKFSIK